MDIMIDEEILEKFIIETQMDSPYGHRGVHNLLLQIKELGYLWNEKHRIILFRGHSCGDNDEEYANYLNRKASGLKATFESKL